VRKTGLLHASYALSAPSLGGVRAVDLAIYADALATRASALAARLERGRDALRQAAIEREARRNLPLETIERLERLDLVTRADPRVLREEINALAADLAALEELQGWVEARLFQAREDARPVPELPREAA
jgi:hypothetical protein